MWYMWIALLLAWSAAVAAKGPGEVAKPEAVAVATTRPLHRTLERQGTDLVWKNWLQSNQNAPPRRITTKSLFITPLICPKGQRLDRNGCVEQVITVNKEEIDRVLLDHLNALFTSAPSEDVVYDYGDEDPGPLQLSIPIGLEPQAAPLQAQEPYASAQNVQPTYVKLDKKDENNPNDAGIVAELELLKLQQSQNSQNDTGPSKILSILNHNVMNNLIPLDKPKRDSTAVDSTDIGLSNDTADNGQKEQIYGHVNIDPFLFNTEKQTELDTEHHQDTTAVNEITTVQNDVSEKLIISTQPNETTLNTNPTEHVLKKDGDKTKLNPENEYANIGERIKLISRYAEVTTDDNFSKEQKFATKDDNILGTRTKLHHRRNKPKVELASTEHTLVHQPVEQNQQKMSLHKLFPKYGPYYRYPWQGQHVPTPPPEYPFRHLQDYWPGQRHIGGVYGTHENPRRHHHNYPYPHNYYRVHYLPHAANTNPGVNGYYSVQLQEYPPRAGNQYGRTAQSPAKNQDLYNLLGLRHWFSSEGTSKR